MMPSAPGTEPARQSLAAAEAVDEFGGNLIFLICQPRSGSTLLQYILGGHPRIHTLPEPWFMLHLLYGLRPTGLAAEYDARSARRGLLNYLSGTGGGRDLFIRSVRTAARSLYGEALSHTEKDLFLDKTPRYYLIAEELREVFPQARFIFLVRNPLAVLASVLQPLGGDWTALRRLDRMNDLVAAPRNIARASTLAGRTAVVRYEDLVQNADNTLSQLLARLDIEEATGLSTYRPVDSTLGDTKSVTKHKVPVGDYVDRWKQDLSSSQLRDLALSYLDALGGELLERLGYSYRDLTHQLGIDRRRGRAAIRWKMLVTPDEEFRWWDRMRLSLIHSQHQRGTSRTILRTAYMVTFGHVPRRRESPDHIDRRPV